MSAPVQNKKKMTGIVAMFKDPEDLKTAAKKIRDAKVRNFDAFTPFPVHGLEHSMGIPRSKLPWITFFGGLTGLATAAGLQTWVAAVNWPLNVGGKPFVSVPAFVPVAFELTVLIAGLSTAAGMFLLTGMPNMEPEILDPEITNDKFALYVSSKDANYKEAEFIDAMKNAGAYDVRILK